MAHPSKTGQQSLIPAPADIVLWTGILAALDQAVVAGLAAWSRFPARPAHWTPVTTTTTTTTTTPPVVALYVDPENGPYSELLGEGACYGVERDGRTYTGPFPIIGHPPCKSWGKFAWRVNLDRSGHDCGPAAIAQAQAHGGVVEHPVGTALWKHCDLPVPMFDNRSFSTTDVHGGFSVRVDQCDWGHPAPKGTYLYICGATPTMQRVIRALVKAREGTGVPTHCIVRKRSNPHSLPELPKKKRHITPPDFARFLAFIAANCRPANP